MAIWSPLRLKIRALAGMCRRALWLEDGRACYDGPHERVAAGDRSAAPPQAEACGYGCAAPVAAG